MSRYPWSIRFLMIAAIGVASVTGCHSTGDDDDDEGWTKEPDLPNATAAPQGDADGDTALKGSDLIPLKKRSVNVKYTEGPFEGKTVEVTIAQGDKGQWVEKARDIRTMYYGESDAGIAMSHEEDYGEAVTVKYDPPFVLAPKKMEPGKPYEATTKMTVLNLKSGSRKASGECKYKVELVKKESIQTPAGTFDAWLIKTTRDIKLDLANVQVTILTWHVPGKGMVASKVQQKTQALGIFGSEKNEAWKLAK